MMIKEYGYPDVDISSPIIKNLLPDGWSFKIYPNAPEEFVLAHLDHIFGKRIDVAQMIARTILAVSDAAKTETFFVGKTDYTFTMDRVEDFIEVKVIPYESRAEEGWDTVVLHPMIKKKV